MNLVITFDYELFGDGSGNIFNHMINPTNEILEICDEFNVKTTIFFEVIEYLVIKKEWDSGNFMGYKKNPIKAIEDQLISAAISGHDIQLHIHPQWTNARYIDGNWLVDFSRWRLSDFKSIGNYTIDSLLRVGKQTIENLLKPYISDYECTILRAGAYNILPSSEIHRAMVKAGLKFDSSVYPGGFQKGELSKYNYTNTSVNLDYWNVNPNDFSIEGNSNIIEIPIFALPKRRIRKLNCNRFRSFFNNITKNSSFSFFSIILEEINLTLSKYIRGQISVCLCLSIFYSLILNFLSLEFGFILGLFIGLISFIPYIGAFLGCFLALILGLVQFGYGFELLITLTTFIIGQLLESYYLTPKLVGEAVKLNPIWIIFALSVGGGFFGFIGILMAIPVAAIIGVIARFYFNYIFDDSKNGKKIN